MSEQMMRVTAVAPANTSADTGCSNNGFDESCSLSNVPDEHSLVTQAFPAGALGVDVKSSDPYLMCDNWFSVSKGEETDPDKFPLSWHPHRGILAVTYMKCGAGRHGDSMGNRMTYRSPSLQSIMAGSGIICAEGGGTPKGDVELGIQIWINLPADRKMDEPKYAISPPESIPLRNVGTNGAKARLLAGSFEGKVGPIDSPVKIQMMDFEIPVGGSITHKLSPDMDTCLIYVYEGNGKLNGSHEVKTMHVALMDASDEEERCFELASIAENANGASGKLMALLLAGKKIKEPIAWKGPIVMNTDHQIKECLEELRDGYFPPVRVPWDYRRISQKQ